MKMIAVVTAISVFLMKEVSGFVIIKIQIIMDYILNIRKFVKSTRDIIKEEDRNDVC